MGARDVETDQTLLEYACQTGNMGLAKLCYRRGANLSCRTKKGASYLNIVTQNKRYDLMEFLHTYGVRVNHQDAEGRTAHMEAAMLLLEVGADMNAKDEKEYTAVAHAEHSNHFALMDRLVELGGKGHGLSSASKGAKA